MFPSEARPGTTFVPELTNEPKAQRPPEASMGHAAPRPTTSCLCIAHPPSEAPAPDSVSFGHCQRIPPSACSSKSHFPLPITNQKTYPTLSPLLAAAGSSTEPVFVVGN